MKKYTSAFVLLLSIILISNISCKKANIASTDVVDKLTANSWVEQDITFKEAGQDLTTQYTELFGDIAVNINANGTYSVTSVKLGVLTSGTWEINDSQTALTVTDSDGTVFILTIVSITDNLLNLEFTYESTGSMEVTVTIRGAFVPVTG